MDAPRASASWSELTCQELVELVTDRLEEALAPALRRAFDRHLAGCAGCRAHLEQVRATLRVLRAMSFGAADGLSGCSVVSRRGPAPNPRFRRSRRRPERGQRGP
jgi:hypothetical protein